jgi:Retrotransposon gag protein/Zinc knuckle
VSASDAQVKILIEGIKALQISHDRINERLEVIEKKTYKICKPEPFTGDPAKLQGLLTRMDLEIDHWGLMVGPEEEEVKFVGYIQGGAGEWYEPILRDFMTNDPDDREDRTTEILGKYEKLKEHMKKAFGDLNEKLVSERRIRECRQRTSVWKYNTEFNQIISHLDWDDDARMAQYRTRLKAEAKDTLIYFEKDATSLDQLMERAQLVDSRIWDLKMEKRFGGTVGRSTTRNKYRTKPEFKRDRGGYVIMVRAKAIDKNECRRKKLCFNCGKPNHQAKNCRSRGKNQKSNSGKDADKPVQSRMAIVREEDEHSENTEAYHEWAGEAT